MAAPNWFAATSAVGKPVVIASLGSTEGDIIPAVTTGHSYLIQNLMVTNISVAAIQVTIYRRVSGTSYPIVNALTIDPNGTCSIFDNSRDVLNDGESITGLSTTTSSAAVTGSYIDIS